MTFSMDCASSASAARRKLVQEQLPLSPLGRFLDFPIQPSCPFWGVRTLPDAFRLPVTSSVRTLFISGVLDGRTPPSNAAEVAAGFKSAHQLVVTNASHTELVSYPPVQKAMSDFLKGTTPPTALTVAPLAFKKLEEMRF